jgi:ubiquinone/menaquinone biosynthesis C-methylase UbiE
MNPAYVHGYDHTETTRLQDQASTLVELLHHDSSFPPGSRVLEVGCGVGAQTVTLAKNSPGAIITAIDVSEASIAQARTKMESAGIDQVTFQRADILDFPFRAESFDHVFVCFVLEHLADPTEALSILHRVIKPGGTITLIEGDHGSVYFYPESRQAYMAIDCQIKLQADAGGNAKIGRELYPLLNGAGYENIQVSPRMVYVDPSKPELVDGFTKKTFIAMIEGVREAALCKKMIGEQVFDKGIEDLYRTTENDGVFCYTFFKAFAEKI